MAMLGEVVTLSSLGDRGLGKLCVAPPCLQTGETLCYLQEDPAVL